MNQTGIPGRVMLDEYVVKRMLLVFVPLSFESQDLAEFVKRIHDVKQPIGAGREPSQFPQGNVWGKAVLIQRLSQLPAFE